MHDCLLTVKLPHVVERYFPEEMVFFAARTQND
jgi:hypothetical protein